MTVSPNGRGGEGRLPGLRFTQPSTLVDHAIALIQLAPQSAGTLAREVLGLTHAPDAMAVRMVEAALGSDPRLRCDPLGVWDLTTPSSRETIGLGELAYAVVDVETTGGMPDRGGRIVEIAIIEVRGAAIVDEYASLVNPGVPITPWVHRLTGITNVKLRGAPPFEHISDEVTRRLEGRVFVAHNVGYDWRFVGTEVRRARQLLPTGPRLCTIHLARRVLPGLRRRGLDAVADYYGVAIQGRHRAAGDARATAHVLIRLLADAERRGVSGWDELNRWLNDPAEGGRPRSAADGATRAAAGEPC